MVTGRGDGEFADWPRIRGVIRPKTAGAIVKVSPPYGPGKVCAESAVNLLPKITSEFSRGLQKGADTDSDPC